MNTQQTETVVEDPAAGVTEVTQVTEQMATPTEVKEAKVEKKHQVIWYVIGLVNALLALRLIFLLLGAKNIGFASFLYAVTDPFVIPFKGIFPAPLIEGSYFDTAGLLAIIVLSLLGWGISSLIDVMNRPAPTA